jgi:biotin-dependent carboxylase-like uncharacterized protein
MNVFEVLDAGGLTTVQDLGRYGFQRYGVPVSGAMDAFALRVANLLVGNAETDACLELTLAGPQLLCLADTVVAVTGGDLQPRLDDGAAPMWEAVPVAAGSVLAFRGQRTGARAYLAVAGGLDVPVVLGSRSTYLRSQIGGIEGRALQPGDALPAGRRPGPVEVRRLPHGFLPTYIGSHTVRVVLGPQASAFTRRGVQTLLGSAYSIATESDRMGYRLEGPAVERCAPADIISDGTPAGAVQVPGSGVPIILLADRGTTGGYTKIATVISGDLPRLAQSGPGDRVFFQAVTIEEAHASLRREAAFLETLRHAPARPFEAGDGGLTVGTATRRAAVPAEAAVRAPLPGRIVQVVVQTGDHVERGQKLCVLEAMKMHNPVCATREGRVTAIHIATGDQVAHGQVLVEVEG